MACFGVFRAVFLKIWDNLH